MHSFSNVIICRKFLLNIYVNATILYFTFDIINFDLLFTYLLRVLELQRNFMNLLREYNNTIIK